MLDPKKTLDAWEAETNALTARIAALESELAAVKEKPHEVWGIFCALGSGDCEGYYKSHEDAYQTLVLTYGKQNITIQEREGRTVYRCHVKYEADGEIREYDAALVINRIHINAGPEDQHPHGYIKEPPHAN